MFPDADYSDKSKENWDDHDRVGDADHKEDGKNAEERLAELHHSYRHYNISHTYVFREATQHSSDRIRVEERDVSADH